MRTVAASPLSLFLLFFPMHFTCQSLFLYVCNLQCLNVGLKGVFSTLHFFTKLILFKFLRKTIVIHCSHYSGLLLILSHFLSGYSLHTAFKPLGYIALMVSIANTKLLLPTQQRFDICKQCLNLLENPRFQLHKQSECGGVCSSILQSTFKAAG